MKKHLVPRGCALCSRFNPHEDNNPCTKGKEKCPIYEKTEASNCYNTPYSETWESFRKLHYFTPVKLIYVDAIKEYNKWKRLSKKMINLLDNIEKEYSRDIT